MEKNSLNLSVFSISKKYKKKQKVLDVFSRKTEYVNALIDVSLEMERGFFAILGPNGAGKSTLINILTGNLRADKGVVLFNKKNIKVADRQFRSILGYMPQQQTLYSSFTGRDFLQYMCALKGISKNQAEEVRMVAEVVNLSNELEKKLGAYSGGMKQRVLAAAAFIGTPRVLIMDEPTAGLDPKERVSLRAHLKKLSTESIVLVATHVVSDIEKVADIVFIIKEGQIVAKGTVAKLIDDYCPGQGLEDVYLAIFGGS